MDVRHRIDGLETLASCKHLTVRVRHRIDGLESFACCFLHTVFVRHRIDGLEMQMAQQSPC